MTKENDLPTPVLFECYTRITSYYDDYNQHIITRMHYTNENSNYIPYCPGTALLAKDNKFISHEIFLFNDILLTVYQRLLVVDHPRFKLGRTICKTVRLSLHQWPINYLNTISNFFRNSKKNFKYFLVACHYFVLVNYL